MNKGIEFWEALINLQTLTNTIPLKHLCKVCGHTTNQAWAMDRHIDEKHTTEIFTLTGNQIHGWNNYGIEDKRDD